MHKRIAELLRAAEVIPLRGRSPLDIYQERRRNMRRAVCLLACRPDGVLAIYRNHLPIGWGLIGGKVDAGETDEQAVIRETKEECGLDAIAVQQIFQRQSRVFKPLDAEHKHAKSWPPRDPSTGLLQTLCSKKLSCEYEKRFGICGLTPGHAGLCICEGLIEDWTITTFQGLVTGELQSSDEGNVGWVSMYNLIQGPFGEYNLALFKAIGCNVVCDVCNNMDGSEYGEAWGTCPKCKGLWK